MTRKKGVKVTKKILKEVCNAVAQDRSIKSLVDSNPEHYPRPETISRYIAQEASQEEKEMYFAARCSQIDTVRDKLTHLRNNPPEITGNKYVDSLSVQIWKHTTAQLLHELTKLGPIFNSIYDKVTKEKTVEKVVEKQEVVLGSFIKEDDENDDKPPIQ